MKLEKNVCMENLQRKKNLKRQKFSNSTQTGITKAHKKTLPAEAVKNNFLCYNIKFIVLSKNRIKGIWHGIMLQKKLNTLTVSSFLRKVSKNKLYIRKNIKQSALN